MLPLEPAVGCSKEYNPQIYNKNLTPTNSPPLINKNKHSSLIHNAQFTMQWRMVTHPHPSPLPAEGNNESALVPLP